nr:MAG TPA: tail collar domain [Caudoviricetes sp.]
MLQIGDTFQDGSAFFKVKKFGADGALVGSVTWYAGAGTPENYLLCDGSAVSRTDYADLFAVISTTYGAGNGSTTFNLPLLTDNRFIEGSTTPGTQHEAGLPNITGEFSYYGWSGCRSASGAFSAQGTYTAYSHNDTYGNTGNNMTIDVSRSNSIYGASTTVQPKSLTLRPLIKYI